jgi:2-polyprenyl-3-methyl-5-hydroxy-6-metoxy-1,4-benzoquinol methylase
VNNSNHWSPFDGSQLIGDGCPICAGRIHAPVTARHGYQYVRCQNCQTVYVNPMPSPQVIQAHYQNPAYFAGDEEMGYQNYSDMHKALASHFRRRLQVVERAIKVKGQLLDLGCADGFFMELAREAGWQTTGVEMAQEMAERTAKALGVHVASSLEALSERNFDAITLWEVIEHLPDPQASLEQLRERLRPGGVLMLSTPNAGHWQAAREPDKWPSYRPPSHLVLFTATGLVRALEQAGLEHIGVYRAMPLPPLPSWLRTVSAPLEHSLATGQAKLWLPALMLWRAIRVLGWAWQKLAHPQDDIFATLEAVAFRAEGERSSWPQ